jgi:hypothetical protein
MTCCQTALLLTVRYCRTATVRSAGLLMFDAVLDRGRLQLPEGTLLLLDETEMAAGQLGECGVKNLQVCAVRAPAMCNFNLTSNTNLMQWLAASVMRVIAASRDCRLPCPFTFIALEDVHSTKSPQHPGCSCAPVAAVRCSSISLANNNHPSWNHRWTRSISLAVRAQLPLAWLV